MRGFTRATPQRGGATESIPIQISIGADWRKFNSRKLGSESIWNPFWMHNSRWGYPWKWKMMQAVGVIYTWRRNMQMNPDGESPSRCLSLRPSSTGILEGFLRDSWGILEDSFGIFPYFPQDFHFFFLRFSGILQGFAGDFPLILGGFFRILEGFLRDSWGILEGFLKDS